MEKKLCRSTHPPTHSPTSPIQQMAADPDFTEDLLWKNLSPEVKQLIMDKGVHEITWGVRTSFIYSSHPPTCLVVFFFLLLLG